MFLTAMIIEVLLNYMELGPARTTQIFVCFAKKKLSTGSHFLVRTIFFTYHDFLNCHQTSKMPSRSIRRPTIL